MNEQTSELREKSVAVHDTLVSPRGNEDCDNGTVHVTKATPTLSNNVPSASVGGRHIICPDLEPGSVSPMKEAGQFNVGGCSSRMLTSKEHELDLPEVFTAEHKTVVNPKSKSEDDGGAHDVLATSTLSWLERDQETAFD